MLDYDEMKPRACRFRCGKLLPLLTYRRQLDGLESSEVVWTPYDDHRIARPFEMISLFSGFIKWGSVMHRHLPERVLRQYGFVQRIPSHPSRSTLTVEEMDHQ